MTSLVKIIAGILVTISFPIADWYFIRWCIYVLIPQSPDLGYALMWLGIFFGSLYLFKFFEIVTIVTKREPVRRN